MLQTSIIRAESSEIELSEFQDQDRKEEAGNGDGNNNNNDAETIPVPSLVTPAQLLQSGQSVVASSKPSQTAHKDVEVVPVSSTLPPEPPVSVAAESQPPILPLPVTSRPTHRDLQVKSSPPVQPTAPTNTDPAVTQSQYPRLATTSTSLPAANGSLTYGEPHSASVANIGI